MPDSRLDWQIEEERQHIAIATPRPRHAIRRPLLIGALALAALGLGVGLGIRQRFEQAEASLRQDILSSHNVILRAADQADADLFAALAADAPGDWIPVQTELVRRGLLYGRSFVGLHAQAGEREVLSVNLSPDRQTAEVVAEHTYVDSDGTGAPPAARLRHTSVYHFDGSSWRLAPLPAASWGRSITWFDERLTLIYPEPDRDTSERLGRDLVDVLRRLCAGWSCPDDLHVELTLATYPMSLITLAAPVAIPPSEVSFAAEGWTRLALPAPTLFGVPADEQAYRALSQGYALRLARVIMAGSIDARDERLQLMPAAIEQQLVRLGLRTWPPIVAESGPARAPIPWPDQDVQMFCVEAWAPDGTLYRYRPPGDAWSRDLTRRVFVSMIPLPGHEGIILQEHRALSGSRIILWRDRRELAVFERPGSFVLNYSLGWVNPRRQNLLHFLYVPDRLAQPGQVAHGLLDLDSCTSRYCEVTTVSRSVYPVWSPNGARTVVLWSPDGTAVTAPDVWNENLVLFRGDSRGQPLMVLDRGANPFWLDNQTYGYILITPNLPSRVVTSTIASDVVWETSWAEDVLNALPERERPARLDIRRVVIDPADVDWVFLEAMDPARPQKAYAFLLHRRSAAVVRLPFYAEDCAYSFSPDGMWLVGHCFDPARSGRAFHLYEIARNRTMTVGYDDAYEVDPEALPGVDWSDDGQWVLALGDGVLHLVAPAYDYQRAIPVFPGCAFAAWVDR
ncbi:MAG TPA: hypothetical protein VJ754_04130 [Anaerolineae bacterium]|nr:hypothetical protein [Anaerolineae bacterium]